MKYMRPDKHTLSSEEPVVEIESAQRIINGHFVQVCHCSFYSYKRIFPYTFEFRISSYETLKAFLLGQGALS